MGGGGVISTAQTTPQRTQKLHRGTETSRRGSSVVLWNLCGSVVSPTALRRIQVRGQSTVELVVVAAVAVMALLGMQTYVRRGLQAKLKATTNDLLRIPGDDGSGTLTQQRGAVVVSQRIQILPGTCPSGAVVQDGVSCAESAQTRHVTETATATGGASTKLLTETQTATSKSSQIFRELRGSNPNPPAPEPPREAPQP